MPHESASRRPRARPAGEIPLPCAYDAGNGVVTQWSLTCWLDGAQARQMATGPLIAFKVQVGGEVHQVSLPSWKAEKFRSNMAVMTSR